MLAMEDAVQEITLPPHLILACHLTFLKINKGHMRESHQPCI